MTNKTELLPCPCCGGDAKEMYTYLTSVEWVACLKCGLETKGFGNAEAASKAWNTRTAPAEDVRAVGELQTFQARVHPWMLECFGAEIAADQQERNHRFLEESLELVQACGATASEAHQLVDYVYGRSIGDRPQEVGGVMVTLAALCLSQELDMHAAAETELARVWTKVEQIRAKQLAKPAIGPLPGVYPDRKQVDVDGKYDEVLKPFMLLMERELHANSHKGDRPAWLNMTAGECLLEIYFHAGKLHKAVHAGDGDGMLEYAADVANLSMMLTDIVGALGLFVQDGKRI